MSGPGSFDPDGERKGRSKEWHRIFESFQGYQTPARMFIPFEGRKPGLESGDVIKMYWQGYALAICNFLDDQLDGQAQYVFEPTSMEDHFDRTAFELEVVKQGRYFAFRAPKARDRMLQARDAGSSICLLFLNGRMGDAESWEIVKGDHTSHWHRLSVTLRSKAPPHLALYVEIVRVGKYQTLGYASQPQSISASREQVEVLANRLQNLEVDLKEKQHILDSEKKKKERQRQTAIQRFQHKHQQNLKGSCLEAWRKRVSHKRNYQLQLKNHQAARNKRLVSDAFLSWTLHHSKRSSLQKAIKRSGRKMCRLRMQQSFNAWRRLGQMSPERAAKLMCSMWVLRRQRMGQCFVEWKALAQDYEIIEQQWTEQRIVSSPLGAWRPEHWPKRLMAKMVKQAMTDGDQRLMRHAFGSWMAKCKVKGGSSGARKLAGRREHHQLGDAFHVWRSAAKSAKLNLAKSKQFERRVEAVLVFVLSSRLHQQPMLASLFSEWRDYCRKKLRQEATVAKLRSRRSQALLRKTLRAWVTVCQDRAASRRTAEDLKSRRDRELVHDAFYSWKEYAIDEQHRREMVTHCEMSKRVAMMYFFEWFGRMLLPSWPNGEDE